MTKYPVICCMQYFNRIPLITARGNARQAIFCDDQDSKVFLECLGREVTQHDPVRKLTAPAEAGAGVFFEVTY